MTDREVSIVIKAYNEADKAFEKVEGDIDKITTTADRAGKTTTQTFNGMLKGVSQIRRGLFQLGAVWGATFGLAIVSINKANESMNKMRDTSVELGMSFQDLQRIRTGLVFDDKELKKAEQSINALGNAWNGLWTALGVGFAKWFPKMAEMNTMTEKQVDILAKLTDETNKLTMSSNDYAKKRIDIDYEKYKNALNLDSSLSAEQMKIREDALNKWKEASATDLARKKTLVENKYLIDLLEAEGHATEALDLEWKQRIIQAYEYSYEAGILAERTADKQIEAFRLARFGLQQEYEIMENMTKESMQTMKDYFADVFIDGLDNGFKNAGEIAQSFFTSLRNMLIRSAIEALMVQAVKAIGMQNWAGAAIAGASSAGVAALGSSWEKSPYSDITLKSGFAEKYGYPQRAGGGYIPEDGLYNLHRGEEVVKQSDTDSGGKVVQYIINAVDARSFAQLVQANPEAIESVVNSSLRYNRSTRASIKKMAR